MARTTPFQFSLRRILVLVAEFGLLLLVARLTWLHFVALKLGIGRPLFAVLIIALMRSAGLVSGGLFFLRWRSYRSR